MPARPTAGRPYFVMELVKGVPITEYCDDKQLVAPRTAGAVRAGLPGRAACPSERASSIATSSPRTCSLPSTTTEPVPKVIDFGVAKATAQKLTERTMFTEFGQVVGTLEYMSPEQAKLNQLDIDTRSDIYSLGVLLYELLTGSTPFGPERCSEAAFDEMLRIIREEEPPKPSTRIEHRGRSTDVNRSSSPSGRRGGWTQLVQGDLDWIVMKCLGERPHAAFRNRDRTGRGHRAPTSPTNRYSPISPRTFID